MDHHAASLATVNLTGNNVAHGGWIKCLDRRRVAPK